ncbi:MAG: hydrogenase maturation nickel metallochaperone HypA [Gemmatimonadaceae bacterium]|nr:hydrogenase maturation nickel metallochaperone HypA [Gemmatimonadaceae bacterium]
MHEIDLAQDIVNLALEQASRLRATRVLAVNLRVGQLAGVEAGALHAAYREASARTVLAGSRLAIIDVPLVVWCAVCLAEVTPVRINRLRCPRCDTAAGEIRRGRELEIAALEVDA